MPREYEKKENAYKRLKEALAKMEMNKTDKEEGKEIALGTSKLNYLDPRITVAWYVIFCLIIPNNWHGKGGKY